MGLFWKALILIIVGLAVLTQLEVPQNNWVATKSMTIKTTPEDAFRFVTTLDYVNKWFPFVNQVKEADSRFLGAGKKLFAVYEVPFYGEYSMVYKITNLKKDKLIVIEGDNVLNPHVEFTFTKIKDKETKLTVTITFRRLSYLFQYTVGPVLHFLVNQKLQFALFKLQALFPY